MGCLLQLVHVLKHVVSCDLKMCRDGILLGWCATWWCFGSHGKYPGYLCLWGSILEFKGYVGALKINPMAKIMQYQHRNPQVALHPPNNFYSSCQLRQPGCVGKTAKRLAANVGEGAMGSIKLAASLNLIGMNDNELLYIALHTVWYGYIARACLWATEPPTESYWLLCCLNQHWVGNGFTKLFWSWLWTRHNIIAHNMK